MTKVAVVTGGTRGIGEAISLKLQEKGRLVIANYGGNDAAAMAFSERTGIAVRKWDVGDHKLMPAPLLKPNMARLTSWSTMRALRGTPQ